MMQRLFNRLDFHCKMIHGFVKSLWALRAYQPKIGDTVKITLQINIGPRAEREQQCESSSQVVPAT